MKRVLSIVAGLFAIGFLLSGCSFLSFGGAYRAAWRHQAESQCLASGRVRTSEFIQARAELDDGSCGADHPFRVQAISNGMVGFNMVVLLNCPMTVAMDDWVEKVVQPQAATLIGQPVVAVKLLGAYTCRKVAGSATMSEHSYMNAIDVAGFKFADGREILVKRDWNSPDPVARQFLRAVGEQSCQIFNTVLGPYYNADHHDHFHMDLAQRRGRRHVCKGGGLHDGPMSYSMPVFTGSIETRKGVDEDYDY